MLGGVSISTQFQLDNTRMAIGDIREGTCLTFRDGTSRRVRSVMDHRVKPFSTPKHNMPVIIRPHHDLPNLKESVVVAPSQLVKIHSRHIGLIEETASMVVQYDWASTFSSPNTVLRSLKAEHPFWLNCSGLGVYVPQFTMR